MTKLWDVASVFAVAVLATACSSSSSVTHSDAATDGASAGSKSSSPDATTLANDAQSDAMTADASSGTDAGAGREAESDAGVVINNSGCAFPPVGVFLVHYVPGSGNTCGPIPDSLLSGADATSASICPRGSGTITDTPIASGGCTVIDDVKGCQVSDNTGSFTQSVVAQITWSVDYSSATGIASFVITTGNQVCSGTYTVTFTKVGADAGAASDAGAADAQNDSQSDATACLVPGVDCTSTPNACCSGICIAPANVLERAFCAAPCTAPAQCASGCCTALSNTTQMACAPIGFCSNLCRGPGAACNSAYDCCSGHTCVTTGGGTCAFICTRNTDCLSNCCAPLNNANISVCSATQFCTD